MFCTSDGSECLLSSTNKKSGQYKKGRVNIYVTPLCFFGVFHLLVWNEIGNNMKWNLTWRQIRQLWVRIRLKFYVFSIWVTRVYFTQDHFQGLPSGESCLHFLFLERRFVHHRILEGTEVVGYVQWDFIHLSTKGITSHLRASCMQLDVLIHTCLHLGKTLHANVRHGQSSSLLLAALPPPHIQTSHQQPFTHTPPTPLQIAQVMTTFTHELMLMIAKRLTS